MRLTILVLALAASSAGIVAQQPSPSSQSTRYLHLLLERPDSRTLFERFYNGWLAEEGTVESLRQFLESRAQSTAVLLIRAAVEEELGDDAASLDWLAQAHEREPKNARVALRLAEQLARAQRSAEALAVLEQIQAEGEIALKIAYLRGREFLRLGNTSEALKVWRDSIEANPNDEDLREDVVELLAAEGNHGEARRVLEELLERTTDPYQRARRRVPPGRVTGGFRQPGGVDAALPRAFAKRRPTNLAGTRGFGPNRGDVSARGRNGRVLRVFASRQGKGAAARGRSAGIGPRVGEFCAKKRRQSRNLRRCSKSHAGRQGAARGVRDAAGGFARISARRGRNASGWRSCFRTTRSCWCCWPKLANETATKRPAAEAISRFLEAGRARGAPVFARRQVAGGFSAGCRGRARFSPNVRPLSAKRVGSRKRGGVPPPPGPKGRGAANLGRIGGGRKSRHPPARGQHRRPAGSRRGGVFLAPGPARRAADRRRFPNRLPHPRDFRRALRRGLPVGQTLAAAGPIPPTRWTPPPASRANLPLHPAARAN